jgi:REP element-mobilizing transposase RayT
VAAQVGCTAAAQTNSVALPLWMRRFDYKQFYRRNLPHIQPPGATLFVTFRLDGSIPKFVIEQWRIAKRGLDAERLRMEALGTLPDHEDEYEEKQRQFQRRWFAKFEHLLHEESSGPTWMKDDRIAQIMAEALHYRDENVYRLDAYCVMSNHIHTVFAPLLTAETAHNLAEQAIQHRQQTANEADSPARKHKSVLSVLMQSLKGYTARQANLALGRSGAFWAHESYDRVIRDQEEWERTVTYVLQNPVKAGLVQHWEEWPWSYRRDTVTQTC